MSWNSKDVNTSKRILWSLTPNVLHTGPPFPSFHCPQGALLTCVVLPQTHLSLKSHMHWTGRVRPSSYSEKVRTLKFFKPRPKEEQHQNTNRLGSADIWEPITTTVGACCPRRLELTTSLLIIITCVGGEILNIIW